jgi:hypothetical protein
MADVSITLVRTGPRSLKPRPDSDEKHTKKDGRTEVPVGSIVTFNVGEPGVIGTKVTFGGDSPFGPNLKEVGYGSPLPVKVAFDESDRQRNKYPYRCHGTGPNGEELDSSTGGGEVEIIR